MSHTKSQKRTGPRLPIVAVNAVIVVDDNRFVLTKRADTGLWCLPGGLVEYGESVEEATLREVKEEIGIKCTIQNLVGIYSINNSRGVPSTRQNSIIIAFRCQIKQGTPGLSDEVSEVGFFSVEQIPDSIIKNQKIRILHAFNNEEPVID